MKIVRVLAMAGAILAGSLSVAGAPASATPLHGDSLAAVAAGNIPTAYARHRGYHRMYYTPRRAYYRHRFYRPYRVYRPYRAYRRHFYRPRWVCRIRYTYRGPRRVCFRRY